MIKNTHAHLDKKPSLTSIKIVQSWIFDKGCQYKWGKFTDLLNAHRIKKSG
jgi:hypothetical protein